ncbi:CHAD domain-containing protein [Paraburkholderia sp.]|uniref:CHAD domain-containing protein n=1 Tax=Paraburkholderia sp. TaxID=1926495 RepID=UPI003D6DAE49
MTRVFELVLDIPAAAAHDWAAARIHRRRDELAAQPDASIVAALTALPAMKRRRRSEARLAVYGFDSKGTLGAAGWRLAIEVSEARQRVIAVHGKPHAPAMTIRDAAFQAPLDSIAGDAFDTLPLAVFGSAPPVLASILDEAGAYERTMSFACTRTRWSLPTQYGVPIDVVFERIDGLDQDDPTPVREIHLTTPVPSDLQDVHSTHAQLALFAAARDIAAALPAFAVLDGAVERLSRGEPVREHEPVHAAPVDLDGDATQRDALLAIGWNLARHWLGNEAGVREAASVEFVHQMRVAQRRLKTAMRLFRHWQDDAWTTQIAPGLKWLGDLLGDARDWDVFADSTLPALAAADTYADAARWDATREAANAHRLTLRARVQQALASPGYAVLVLAWLEWQGALADDARALPEAAGRTLRKHAKKSVSKAYEKLAAAPKLTTLDDASRHRERIRAKRLRYTLEFLAPLATKKTRVDVSKTLSRMQGVLGDGNDAAVALGFLEQLDVDPYQLGFARGWCEAAKRYTAREGERLLRQLGKPRLDG